MSAGFELIHVEVLEASHVRDVIDAAGSNAISIYQSERLTIEVHSGELCVVYLRPLTMKE